MRVCKHDVAGFGHHARDAIAFFVRCKHEYFDIVACNLPNLIDKVLRQRSQLIGIAICVAVRNCVMELTVLLWTGNKFNVGDQLVIGMSGSFDHLSRKQCCFINAGLAIEIIEDDVRLELPAG
jgi:hypothetical protein